MARVVWNVLSAGPLCGHAEGKLVRNAQTACGVGRHLSKFPGTTTYIAPSSSDMEAAQVQRRVHMATTETSSSSRISWHIFDRSSAKKSASEDKGGERDTSDAAQGVRWRIVESRDLRTINKEDGKIVDKTAATFLPEHAAPLWPPMMVSSHSGEEQFSRPEAGINARIVLASYRASAEMYLAEWRNVIKDTFGDQMDVELVELAVCDLAIMKMWPLKGFLVNSSRAKESKAMLKMPVRQVHYFGEEAAVTEGLQMNNRLTGYVFVVDSQGRIRWKATGKVTESESHSMMQAVRKLAPNQDEEADS